MTGGAGGPVPALSPVGVHPGTAAVPHRLHGHRATGDSPGDPYTATSGDLRYCVGLANANTSNPAGSLIQSDPHRLQHAADHHAGERLGPD